MNGENEYIMSYNSDNCSGDEIPINYEFINNDGYQTDEIFPNYEEYQELKEEEESIEITEQRFNNKESEEMTNEGLKIPCLHKHCASASVASLIKAQEVNMEGIKLKNGISSIFSTRKNIPKKYVFLIHKNYLMNEFKFLKMSRDERRCNEVYYNNYAHMKNQILQYLENHKEEITNKIFSDYKHKKNNNE